jgi:hypothetical protein
MYRTVATGSPTAIAAASQSASRPAPARVTRPSLPLP